MDSCPRHDASSLIDARNRRTLVSGTLGAKRTSVAILLGLVLALYAAIFGTADIEESANSSYSIGADYSLTMDNDRGAGIQTVFGVPVYDTLQGTGDRLPYQASWAQSVSWWSRLLVGWEHQAILRSLLFAIPGLWLCLATLQSWLPRVRWLSLVVFGLLCSSSFGLHLRQNEWSDHYVQTIGVCTVSMFFMHRWFHDTQQGTVLAPQRASIICLAVALNGVVTGHPGFWPIALAIWLALAVVFVTSKAFSARLALWVRDNLAAVSVVLVATIISLGTIVRDLISELAGQSYTVGRLGRTQGLFSEFALSGLYGLSSGGVLPPLLKSVIASVLATTSMPLFIVFDQWLPQALRASDFRELPRVEFSGALIIVAIVLGWSKMKQGPVRSLIARLMVAQLIIWLYVAASAADLLPSAVAASGAWMTVAVVLVFNVFVAWLLLGNLSRERRVVRVVAVSNLVLVAVWCLFQFGFVSFGSGLRVPERHPSWFRSADALAQSPWFVGQEPAGQRVLMPATPSFYDFLSFVALGVPVVAPADPKMRAANHLQASFGLNYSINPPTFERLDDDQLDRLLDFLQVRYVAVGYPLAGEPPLPVDPSTILPRLRLERTPPAVVSLPRMTLEIHSRTGFSAFVGDARAFAAADTCATLQEACPVVHDTERVDPRATARLTMCDEGCLWRYETPVIAAGKALLLPVTHDDTLVVRDEDGSQLITMDAGGFLAVYSATGIAETTLAVDLEPDGRMLLRVFASYANLLMLAVLVVMLLYPGVSSRWQRDRAPRQGNAFE